MNTLIKGAIAFGGVAGAGGISYGIYNAVRTPTYGEVLKGTLLSTDKGIDNEKWISRLTTLKDAKEETLVEALKAIKKGGSNATADQLIAWCKTIINDSNKGEKAQEFQNIQNYCTFSVNEKLTNAIPATTDKGNNAWGKAHKAINDIKEEDLDKELREAKIKTAQQAKEAAHKWCTETYKKPYKGANDKDFKNASVVCLNRD